MLGQVGSVFGLKYAYHKTAATDATVPTIPFKSINILIRDRITIGKMQYPKTEAITPT